MILESKFPIIIYPIIPHTKIIKIKNIIKSNIFFEETKIASQVRLNSNEYKITETNK